MNKAKIELPIKTKNLKHVSELKPNPSKKIRVTFLA